MSSALTRVAGVGVQTTTDTRLSAVRGVEYRNTVRVPGVAVTLATTPATAPQTQALQRINGIAVALVGPRGRAGESGMVGGTMPWSNITGKPWDGQESFTLSRDGEQTITLTNTPTPGTLTLHINGLLQLDLPNLSLTNRTVNLAQDWNLCTGDVLTFTYKGASP